MPAIRQGKSNINEKTKIAKLNINPFLKGKKKTHTHTHTQYLCCLHKFKGPPWKFMDYFDLWVGLGLKKKYKMMPTSTAL